MGSLMAGWDSPVLESKSDIYKRNHSLTNDEIESFWRSSKKLDEKQQHIDIHDDTIYEEKTATVKKSDKKFQRSNTVPPTRTRGAEQLGQKYFLHGETETMASTAHKLPESDNTGWWTRSNWAFLNEPPTLLEDPPIGTRTRYASQFHVANSSGGVNGIST